ncbi:uncharacterized protein LOC116805251 isoform X2 [Drosophila grimshawi]|nr:uncharacterized protein LOC116805251 isoform X2 [Drosophila grimshawi]
MKLVMANSLDFSPFEDSDSGDLDSINSPNRNNSPAIEPRSSPEIYQKREPSSPASQKSDSAYSTNTYAPAESMDLDSKPDRLLAIEEANLDIQREKLKALKSIADELSSIHRDFLKVYSKHK